MIFTVKWSEEDKNFVGLCDKYPSLSWLAESKDEAMECIRKLVSGIEDNN